MQCTNTTPMQCMTTRLGTVAPVQRGRLKGRTHALGTVRPCVRAPFQPARTFRSTQTQSCGGFARLEAEGHAFVKTSSRACTDTRFTQFTPPPPRFRRPRGICRFGTEQGQGTGVRAGCVLRYSPRSPTGQKICKLGVRHRCCIGRARRDCTNAWQAASPGHSTAQCTLACMQGKLPKGEGGCVVLLTYWLAFRLSTTERGERRRTSPLGKQRQASTMQLQAKAGGVRVHVRVRSRIVVDTAIGMLECKSKQGQSTGTVPVPRKRSLKTRRMQEGGIPDTATVQEHMWNKGARRAKHSKGRTAAVPASGQMVPEYHALPTPP